jgi:hypothetical protein
MKNTLETIGITVLAVVGVIIGTIISIFLFLLQIGLLLGVLFMMAYTVSSAWQAAHGAEFSVQYIKKDRSAVVNLDGQITLADPLALFKTAKAVESKGYKIKAMRFNSPGGNVAGGMTIANMVHGTGIETYVNRGKECYSACFVAFMGGYRKFAAFNAKIGMHSLFNPDLALASGTPVEDRDSLVLTMELVRWMKRELKISDYVVGTIVTTPPDQMHDYSIEELQFMGVELF